MHDIFVLGINRTHDVSAALFKNNELLMLGEAERITQIKHSRGARLFEDGVDELIKQVGIDFKDIDAISIADSGRESIEMSIPRATKDMHSQKALSLLDKETDLPYLPLGSILRTFRSDIQFFGVCHHAAHALSAVYQSGFSECAVLVADGYGVCCGTIAYFFKDGKLKRLEEFRDLALLGWRYQLFGTFVKEINHQETDVLDLAGKIMGLNAYGTAQPEQVSYFMRWFKKGFDDYSLCWRTDLTFFLDLVPGGLKAGESSVDELAFRKLVASMQEAFSATMFEVARSLVDELKVERLVVTGGCALNVLSNTKLSELAKEVFFQPNAGDSGISIGAAASAAAHLSGTSINCPPVSNSLIQERRNPFKGYFLIDDKERADAVLRNSGRIQVKNLPRQERSSTEHIIDLLSIGKIIGIVGERSEMGPRALGNRSILANPTFPNMKDVINQKIKKREWWRPFAPVCRLIDAEKYFDFSTTSPYMLLTATVKTQFRVSLKPACHEDGTARLQVIPDRTFHPQIWDLLEHMDAKGSIPVLINTSFNVGGKPLLNHTSTAIEMLVQTDLDGVWMKDTFYHKN